MNVRQFMVTASHHCTWRLGTRFPEAIPLVFVVGYPKSGTTWMSQLVADYLQLPFPRFSRLPIGFAAVVHGHEGVWSQYPRCVYSLRDGRDALVSHYFHLSRAVPEGDHPQLSRIQRRIFPGLVNKARVRENLPAFLERQMKDPVGCPLNWGEHALSAIESDNAHLAILRYEVLLADGAGALGGAIEKLTGEEVDQTRLRATIDKYSFKRQSGRRAGQENRASFFRKGQAGDWRNHFTRESAEIFDDACGKALIACGYEQDRSWVVQTSREAREAPRVDPIVKGA